MIAIIGRFRDLAISVVRLHEPAGRLVCVTLCDALWPRWGEGLRCLGPLVEVEPRRGDSWVGLAGSAQPALPAKREAHSRLPAPPESTWPVTKRVC